MTDAAAPTAPILVAEGVRKTYRGAVEVEVLKGIDLTVHPGELVAVMGPSGNGKTTLLNCLSGLDEIDGGRVLIDGEDIHAMADAKRTEHRARRMGFVFQCFNLIPVFTAAENVELPLLVTGVKAKEARRRAEQMLELVGLAHRLRNRPPELSGGEQQRVAIARALVTEPAIIWADEPTGNLDSETAASVLALLKEVHAAGQTIVMVTHDTTIGRAGTRLVRVTDGLVTYDGGSDVLDLRDEPPKKPARRKRTVAVSAK
jgi:putative ABC transport system ATP-binding protein